SRTASGGNWLMASSWKAPAKHGWLSPPTTSSCCPSGGQRASTTPISGPNRASNAFTAAPGGKQLSSQTQAQSGDIRCVSLPVQAPNVWHPWVRVVCIGIHISGQNNLSVRGQLVGNWLPQKRSDQLDVYALLF